MSVRSILINDKINSSLIPIKAGSNITLRYDTDGIRISSTGGGGGGGTLEEVLTNGNDAVNQAILNLSEINTVGPLELTSTNNLTLNGDNSVIITGTNTTITNSGTLTSNTLGNVNITSSAGNINTNAINMNSTATGNNTINGDAINLIASKNLNITSSTQNVNITSSAQDVNITSSTQDVNINALNDNININSVNCNMTQTGALNISASSGVDVNAGAFQVDSIGAVNIASTISSATLSGGNVNVIGTGINTITGDSVNINSTDKNINLNASDDANIRALTGTINIESVDCYMTQTGLVDISGSTVDLYTGALGGDITLTSSDSIFVNSTTNTNITSTTGGINCSAASNVVISGANVNLNSTAIGGDIIFTSTDNIFANSTTNTNITSGTNTFITSTVGAINCSAGTNVIIGANGALTAEGDTVDIEGTNNVLIKSNNQKVILHALSNSVEMDCLDMLAVVTDEAKITAGGSVVLQTLGVNKNINLIATGNNSIQGLNNVMTSTNTTEINSDNNILVRTNNANTTQGNIDINSFRLIVSNNFVTNVPAGQDQGYIRTRLNGSVVNYGIPYFNISSGFTMSTDGLLWTNPPTNPTNYAKYLYNNSGVLEWRTAGGGSTPFSNATILAMSPTYFWDFTDESKYTGISAGQVLDQAFTNCLDLTSGKTFSNQANLRTNRISNTGTLRILNYLAGASGFAIDKSYAPQPSNSNWCVIMAGMFCYDNTVPNNGVPMFYSIEGGSFFSRFFIPNYSRWDYKNIGVASVFNDSGTMLVQQQPNKYFNTQIQSPFVWCMQNRTGVDCRVFCNGQICTTGTVANYPNPLSINIAIGNIDPSSFASFASLSHNSTTQGSLTHLLCLTGANSTDDNRQKIESYLMRVITGSTWNLSPSNPYKMTPP